MTVSPNWGCRSRSTEIKGPRPPPVDECHVDPAQCTTVRRQRAGRYTDSLADSSISPHHLHRKINAGHGRHSRILIVFLESGASFRPWPLSTSWNCRKRNSVWFMGALLGWERGAHGVEPPHAASYPAQSTFGPVDERAALTGKPIEVALKD